jgi:hypothetical protein
MLDPGSNRELPPIPAKRYFTIGGARLRLDGPDAREESALSNQIIKQVRMELEEVLQLLRR